MKVGLYEQLVRAGATRRDVLKGGGERRRARRRFGRRASAR